MLTRKQFFNRSLILPAALWVAGCGGSSDRDNGKEQGDSVPDNFNPQPPMLAPQELWNQTRLFHADTARINQQLLLQNSDGFAITESVNYGGSAVSPSIRNAPIRPMRIFDPASSEIVHTLAFGSSYFGLTTAIAYPNAQITAIGEGTPFIQVFVPQSLPPKPGTSIVRFVNVCADLRAQITTVLINGKEVLNYVPFEKEGQSPMNWGDNRVQIVSRSNPSDVLLDATLTVPPDNRLYTAVFYGGTDGQPFALRLLVDL